MKKILLAMIAVIATASMAVADVTFGGYGRFGVHYNEANSDKPQDDTNLVGRLRLQVDMSAQSDVGINLGARFRLQYDQKNGSADDTHVNGGRWHASMGAVRIEAGNIADAIDNMPGFYLPTKSVSTGLTYHNDGLVSLNDFTGYDSAGIGTLNGVSFIYSTGNLGLQLSSVEGKDSNTENDAFDLRKNDIDNTTNPQTSAHVHYTIGGWQLALGVLNSDDDKDMVIGTVTGDIGFAKVGAAFGSNDGAGPGGSDADKVRLYGNIPVGAATKLVIWGADEDRNGANDGGSFGLTVEHDLGGGAVFVAGYGEDARDESAQASAGITFAF